MGHTCHALRCTVRVPPRMHMHRQHRFMVPKALRDELWAAYRPGQERDKRPSARYLRAAAACIRAVAEKEGIPEDEIVAGTEDYLRLAELLEEKGS